MKIVWIGLFLIIYSPFSWGVGKFDCRESLTWQALSVVADQSVVYTPSEWHVRGEDLAIQVINSLSEYYVNSSDSVWINFQQDSRYEGPLILVPSQALSSAALHFGSSTLRNIDAVYLSEMERYIASNPLPGPYFFITWEPMGIRAINRLTAQRIHLVGLTDHSLRADGGILEPEEYLIHDINHAHSSERAIGSSPIFFEHFNYDYIVSHLSASDRVLFDIGYFMYFHESYSSYGRLYWGDFFENIRSKNLDSMTPEQIEEYIKSTYKTVFNHLPFEGFSDDSEINIDPPTFQLKFYDSGDVEVKIAVSKPGDFLISRFLDKSDLRVNLPNEVKNQIKEHPERGYSIIQGFLENAFSLFLTQHYAVAKKILGL